MSHIILGMARGSKAADPAVRVLPGFLHMPELAVVLNQSHVEVLDGIQLHLYSWRQHQRGRTGVHPEHRFSLFRGLASWVDFRDRNMPGLPLLVTEFGWDSEGGGEQCDPHDLPECVSEHAQVSPYAITRRRPSLTPCIHFL